MSDDESLTTPDVSLLGFGFWVLLAKIRLVSAFDVPYDTKFNLGDTWFNPKFCTLPSFSIATFGLN